MGTDRTPREFSCDRRGTFTPKVDFTPIRLTKYQPRHTNTQPKTQPSIKPTPRPRPKYTPAPPAPIEVWLRLDQVKPSGYTSHSNNSDEISIGLINYRKGCEPLYQGTVGGLLNKLGLDKIKNRPVRTTRYEQDGVHAMTGAEIEVTDLSKSELLKLVDVMKSEFGEADQRETNLAEELIYVQMSYSRGKIHIKVVPRHDIATKKGYRVTLGWQYYDRGSTRPNLTSGPRYGAKKEVGKVYAAYEKNSKDNLAIDQELPYIWQRQELPPTAISSDQGPNPNTNLIYLAYFVEEQVVKIGRTTNWDARCRTYMRGGIKISNSSSVMQLLDFHYTDPEGVAPEDETPKLWVLYCYESVLKELSKSSPHLEQAKDLGEEYYRLTPDGDLDQVIRDFREHFDHIILEKVLAIRNKSQLRSFCADPKMRRDPVKLSEELDRLVQISRR